MSKRSGILEDFKNYLSGHQSRLAIEKTATDVIADVYRRLYDYYDIYDLEHKTNYKEIFKILYFEKLKISFEELAEEMAYNLSTIKRYIKKYNRLALKLVRRDYKSNATYCILKELSSLL